MPLTSSTNISHSLNSNNNNNNTNNNNTTATNVSNTNYQQTNIINTGNILTTNQIGPTAPAGQSTQRFSSMVVGETNKPVHAHSTSLLANESYLAGMSSDSELTSNAIRHHHRPHSSQSRIYHAHPAPRNSHTSSRVSHYSDSSAAYTIQPQPQQHHHQHQHQQQQQQLTNIASQTKQVKANSSVTGPISSSTAISSTPTNPVSGKQQTPLASVGTGGQMIMSDPQQQQQQQQHHYLPHQVSSSGAFIHMNTPQESSAAASQIISNTSSSSRQVNSTSSPQVRRHLPARPFKHSTSIDQHSMSQYHQQAQHQTISNLISPSKVPYKQQQQQQQVMINPNQSRFDPNLEIYQRNTRIKGASNYPTGCPVQSPQLVIAADMYATIQQPISSQQQQQQQQRDLGLEMELIEKQTAQIGLYDQHPETGGCLIGQHQHPLMSSSSLLPSVPRQAITSQTMNQAPLPVPMEQTGPFESMSVFSLSERSDLQHFGPGSSVSTPMATTAGNELIQQHHAPQSDWMQPTSQITQASQSSGSTSGSQQHQLQQHKQRRNTSGIATGIQASSGNASLNQFKQTMSVDQYHYSPTRAQVAPATCTATATIGASNVTPGSQYKTLEHAAPFRASLGSSSSSSCTIPSSSPYVASVGGAVSACSNTNAPQTDYVTSAHASMDKFSSPSSSSYRSSDPSHSDDFHILQQQQQQHQQQSRNPLQQEHRASQQDILLQQQQHHQQQHHHHHQQLSRQQLQHHGSSSSIYNQSSIAGARTSSGQQHALANRSQLQHQISSGSSTTNSQSGSLRSSNIDISRQSGQIEHPRAGSLSQLHQFHYYPEQQQQQQQQHYQQQQQQQSPLRKHQLRDPYNETAQQHLAKHHHYQQQPLRKGYTSLALGDSSSTSLLANLGSSEPHSTSSSSSASNQPHQQQHQHQHQPKGHSSSNRSTAAAVAATSGAVNMRDRSIARAQSPSRFEEIGTARTSYQQNQARSNRQGQACTASGGIRSESTSGLPKSASNSSSLTKKSNSTTQLSMTGTKKRLGFRKKQVTSFSVHRSEEVAPLAARHLVKQGSSVSEGDSSMSGDSSRGSLNLNYKHQGQDDLASMSFIEGLGTGQMISRQGLASPYLGDLQLSLCDRRGNLEVEVIRARNLQAKANKLIPLTYVKLYLVKNRKCLAKTKTTLSSKRTLDPLFQQQLLFHEDYRSCILQAIVWGNFGKIDKKNFMGIAQISIDDLELSDTVISWYKLFLPSSLQTMPSKSLRSSLLSNSTESFTNTNSASLSIANINNSNSNNNNNNNNNSGLDNTTNG